MNENNKMARVYHASPESHLSKLRTTGSNKGTQAHPQRQAGVYVSPKFIDAVAWAVSFVIHKKDKSQENKRSKREYKTDQYGMHKEPMKYQHITIYELEVPKEVIARSWKNTNWEPEYFITDVDTIKIVSSRTYHMQELFAMHRRSIYQRNEHQHKDMDKIAAELRSNYAAREYLRLKETMQQKALQGEISAKALEEFRIKIKYLEPYFLPTGSFMQYDAPLERVDPIKLPKVQQLVATLDALLSRQ